MFDKNGIEFKTGDIVEITGAFFKNDNGFYFVRSSPGDPGWIGSDHCLKKISKKGKISVAKHSTCFWPILVCSNSRFTVAEARCWNEEHAQIEVKSVADMSEVIGYFRERAESSRKSLKRMVWDFGDDAECVQKERAIIAHYEAVVARLAE